MDNGSLIVRQPSWKEDDMAIICGIANAGGGSLLINANQKNYSSGMRKIRKTFELIPSISMRDLGIACTTEPIMDGSQLCLCINIPKPDFAVSYFGKYYLYSNSTNQIVSKDAVERSLQRLSDTSWEKEIQPQMQRSDIDSDILSTMSSIADLPDPSVPNFERLTTEILEEYNLLDPLTDSITNVGVLLLHKAPHTLIPGAVIRIGEFDSSGISTGKSDLIFGPLTKQLKSALKTLDEIYHVTGHIDADNTKPFVPEKAMKEALINALIHKDYSSGIAININIYPEAVFVENVGRPPLEWTSKTLEEKHSSRPNNPFLAIALHKSDFFNGWGNGIEIIRNTCENIGSCIPSFILSSDETIVQFEFKDNSNIEALKELNEVGYQTIEYAIDNLSSTNQNKANNNSDIVDHSSINQNEDLFLQSDKTRELIKRPRFSTANSRFSERSFAAANDLDLTSTDEYVLKVLDTNGRVTAARIAEVLGVSESTIRRSFRKLRAQKIIERIGSNKAGYWKVMI